MTIEEYQAAVVEGLNNVYIMMWVIAVVIAAFFIYVLIHNMINRR